MENMEEKKISYLEYESSQARMERTNKRMWILCIILIISLIGTNGAWIYYENQFEGVTVTQEAQADGDSDIQLVGGDYNGGESKTDNQLP